MANPVKKSEQTVSEGKCYHTGLKIIAGLLDLLSVVIVGTITIALLTDSFVSNQIHLNESASAALVILIGAYFIIGKDFLGGTIWQRILRTK